MIKILRFESDKASVLPYLYAQPKWVIQQCIEEDKQITIMKKLTCDNRVDEVCKALKEFSQGFDDYIRHLCIVNQKLSYGIELSEIINYLKANKYESYRMENDCMMKLNAKQMEAYNAIIGRYCVNKEEITDIDIIVPDKVVEVTFADGLKEKMVCQKEDTFNLRNCLFIAIAKHLYKKDYTLEGIEWKAFELTHLKKYVKIVDSALKAFDKKQKNVAKLEENRKAELERIERKRAKRQAYKERRAAKREQVEKEKQIQIQKEAYIQAMEYINNK